MSIRGGQTGFRSFEAARAFAHALQFTSSEAWTEFCASGQRPSDIPSNPQITYHRDWRGWRDWLGTGQTRNARSERYKFRSFEDARHFARSLSFSGRTEWRLYCASPERPIDIPTNPNSAYRSQWKGWGDWLGTGNTINSFLPFEESRRIASRPYWVQENACGCCGRRRGARSKTCVTGINARGGKKSACCLD
jgi:hypothetical protein